MPAAAIGGKVVAIPEGSAINKPNRDGPFPWTMVLTGENGQQVEVDTQHRYEQLSSGHLRYVSAEARFPQHEGVAVFARPDIDRAAMGIAMQQQGIRTVAESDDNYQSPAKGNLFLRQQGADDLTREAHSRAMASFRVNVFSTVWLRDRYYREFVRRFGKVRAREVEMHVCRNHLPAQYWPEVEEHDGRLRVGFMGSPSHIWDVDLSHAAFETAKELGCETWMVGYSPGHIDRDTRLPEKLELEDGTPVDPRTPESYAAEADWACVIDHHVPWVAPSEFRRAALPFDIGIAPLIHSEFNSGRSDIKAIEYVVSGAAVICANLPAYNRAGWEHNKNCLMANSPVEYARAVLRLVKEPGLRSELVAAGQQMVRDERDEEALRSEWNVALGLA